MDETILVVSSDDSLNFRRLDQFLSDRLESVSRTVIKDLFKKGLIVAAADQELELKKMPPAGTRIIVLLPEKTPAKAQDIPLEILYQDEHLIFINKIAGMVTHPAPGNYDGTLVNAILHHCPDIEGVGDERRPGIVHRLDKGTSGVMVVAKNDQAHQGLVELFSNHDIERRYEALVVGSKMERGGVIRSLIARHRHNRLKMTSRTNSGKEAITHFKVINYFKNCSHIELKLETGRTHQIRVHMSEIKNSPILCDSLYGNPANDLNRLGESFKDLILDYPFPFLHAKVLGLIHPITKESLRFEAPCPLLFQQVINLAQRESS